MPVRVIILFLLAGQFAFGESGYDLWLAYHPLPASGLRTTYREICTRVRLPAGGKSNAVLRREFSLGFEGMLSIGFHEDSSKAPGNGIILVRTGEPLMSEILPGDVHSVNGDEGFLIRYLHSGKGKKLVIAANSDIGLIYGAFHLLRMMSMQMQPDSFRTTTSPKVQYRMLNHWDNLDRTVERGYAGQSIWNWQLLPKYIDKRYIDYARANASIGINATVLTNVNANATILTTAYLEKVRALADIFRPYGIRVFLPARFNAPMEMGDLTTADPLNEQVKEWWKKKADEIYRLIPDFGGFLVKANSEGQPGPQNYGRSHADGANILAEALAPHQGILIWRAFVYSSSEVDRFKQAYEEFLPLDGKFRDNVVIQVKNGPIDFQPREPFHPLFGAMTHTSTGIEFQVTQEYLGFSSHLVYEAPLFSEVLQTDTYRPREGSKVARIIDGSALKYTHTVMAGVSNIGSDLNWCGHPFAQANWYAFGRLAWDPDMPAERIAREWIGQTFVTDRETRDTILDMMMRSRENTVNYMTPLGLHHIMGYGHHYGPAPWFDKASRPDWNCTYYHRADSMGIGFERTASGSNAINQYAGQWVKHWSSPVETDEKLLLWFHHLSWNYHMKNGETLWVSLCRHYQDGVEGVRKTVRVWDSLRGKIDPDRFEQVRQLLAIQLDEATWWRDACLSYFMTFSGQPLPAGVEKPEHNLEYYRRLQFPYAPGTGR